MISDIDKLLQPYIPWPSATIWISLGIFIVVSALFCWLVSLAIKRMVVRTLQNLMSSINPRWGNILQRRKVIYRLFNIVPVLLLYGIATTLQTSKQKVIVSSYHWIEIFCLTYITVVIAIFWVAFLDSFEQIYRLLPISRRLPIKTYVQVLKLILISFTVIIISSIVLDISLGYFYTSLGAATAVLMLVFKDSITGFFASIQLSLYDIVRIGDWITAPAHHVDGDVEDISLSMVTVRNFDKTIVNVPTYALINSGLQNWRGMEESGGRRIKRSISLDMDGIRFLSNSELKEIQKGIPLLSEFIEEKLSELSEGTIPPGSVTNSLLFREFITHYLKQHPDIHQENFTFLIRQLQPSDKGLPIEIYVFTKTTNWKAYEQIQADIFDFVIASIGLFDLKLFQSVQAGQTEGV